MAQFFKGDDFEKKFYNSVVTPSSNLEIQLDLFFANCFTCFVLGDVLYDTGRAPLANAIPKEIFRESFSDVFDAFVVSGSLESYLTVFRKIFGQTVDVEFTIPSPGKLQIDITGTGFELSPFVARHIESNEYVFDNMITEDVDQIVFQTVKGFQSQYDLEQMLFEMVPDGIYTEINLSVG